MQILNQTHYRHDFTMGMDKAGREFLSLVVKGTFAFPATPRDVPTPADEQRALVMAEEFTGAPGFSATLRETDFAFRKTACDVILQGAAYAPGGQPAERVRVGLRVGDLVKQFDVVGQREWRGVGPVITSTRPYPFTRQSFSYGTAFGGPNRSVPEDPAPPVYLPNPVGIGDATLRTSGQISGLPLPNTEAVGEEVSSPFGHNKPMALGPMSRGAPERLRYAGSCEDHWKDHAFPFLSADFDERCFQTAPLDQQIAYSVTGDKPETCSTSGKVYTPHGAPEAQEATAGFTMFMLGCCLGCHPSDMPSGHAIGGSRRANHGSSMLHNFSGGDPGPCGDGDTRVGGARGQSALAARSAARIRIGTFRPGKFCNGLD